MPEITGPPAILIDFPSREEKSDLGRFKIADLAPDPPWMLIDVQYGEWEGCGHCGTALKRAFLIEETATGERLVVGKTCLGKFGISS